jgi:hypothetical protein
MFLNDQVATKKQLLQPVEIFHQLNFYVLKTFKHQLLSNKAIIILIAPVTNFSKR